MPGLRIDLTKSEDRKLERASKKKSMSKRALVKQLAVSGVDGILNPPKADDQEKGVKP